jgi:Uma2 family endonuclease
MPQLQNLSTPGSFDLLPLTVTQYHRMLETGILEEGAPIELLDGFLVLKDRGDAMTVNPLHALIVNRLMRISAELEERGAHLRLQCPITLPPDQEPEPDAVIVRGGLEAFLEEHPTAKDVCCAVEIADTSLERDRTTKQRIYAAAGIPQYVLANLKQRQVEIYQEPEPEAGRYRQIRIAVDGDVQLNLPRGLVSLPVKMLLP